jgi:hypothetical protein
MCVPVRGLCVRERQTCDFFVVFFRPFLEIFFRNVLFSQQSTAVVFCDSSQKNVNPKKGREGNIVKGGFGLWRPIIEPKETYCRAKRDLL